MKKILLLAVTLFFATGATKSQVTVIGGATATYTSLGDAFAAINAGTHTGAITVDLSASVTETASAILNSSGAGSANYSSVLIFPSVDGITINGSATAASGRGVIELNGTDNVTIDGDNPNTPGINKNLTIINNNSNTTTYASVLRIATTGAVPYADANNITIKNLILNGNATGRNLTGVTSTTGSENTTYGIIVGNNGGPAVTPITAVAGVIAATATVNAFVVNNCSINQAARGIAFNGNTSASSTSVTITNNTIGANAVLSGNAPFVSPANSVYTKGIVLMGINGLTISGNTIQNILSYVATSVNGIELNSNIGNGGVSVSNNTITGVALNNSGVGNTVRGISIQNTAGTYTVDNNIISNIQTFSTGRVSGLFAGTSATSALIEKNKISKVYNTNAGTWGSTGLLLSSGNNVTLRNNFVWDVNQDITGGGAFSTSFGIHGIQIAGGTGHKVYHNTVNMNGSTFGTASTSNLTTAFSLVSTASTGVDIRNNIFSNTLTGGSTSVAHVALYLPSGGTSAMALLLNNNAYYSATTSTSQGIAQVGTTAGTGFYTAANFNASAVTPAANLRAYTSTLGNITNDNAALGTTMAAPFISSTNIHINNSGVTLLESAGAVTSVTTDIDNDVRPGPVGSVNGGALAPDIGADEFDGLMPSCFMPTALNTGSISPTAANFTWTPGGAETVWNIYYGVQPLATPNATTVPTATSSSASFSATGLSPTTAYAVYVSANCGPGNNSVWSAVSNFTTTALCPATTSLNVTNITPTSSNFTWTAGGSETAWDLYYGVQPLTIPSGTTVPTATSAVTNYSATGLTPNTAYAVYVRANCGGANGASLWSLVQTFTTPCTTSPLPITEGFNATSIPSCWSQQYVSGASNLQYVATSGNPATTPFEGTDYVMFNSFSISSGNETRLVSLPLTSAGVFSVDVNFRWFNENNTSYSTGSYLNEGVMVQYSTNGTTWTDVQFFPRHDGSLAASTGQWKLKSVTLPAGAGNQGLVYVGFKFHSSFGDNCSLDKVDVIATPGCTLTPVAGTISGVSTTTIFTTSSYTISPSAGNLQWYTAPAASSTVLTGISNGTNSIVNYTATTGGTVYLTVIASNPGCPNDTANVYFPVTVIYPGDDACNPIPLSLGASTTYYKLLGASVQSGEVAPPGTSCTTNNSWCNNTLNNTRWFTFVAPASGNVSVQSPGFDTQLAVWTTTNCVALASPTNAVLIGANDDDNNYVAHGGVNFSSYVRALCLTPGATYYIQLDSYGTISANDSTKVLIADLGANSFNGPATNYCLPSTTSASLVPNIPGGAFTINTSTTTVTAFTPSVVGAGSYTINYNAFGCISNSVVTVDNTPTVIASAANTVICQGGSTSLNAAGANTYTWNTSATGSVIAVTPSVTTTYTVTGDSNGCTDSDTVVVTVNGLPSVSLTASQMNTCVNGSTIGLTGSPSGGVYTGSNVSGPVFTPSASAGTFMPVYSVTDATTGCSNSASVTLTVYSLPNVSLTAASNTACTNGPTISLTGSPSSGAYSGANVSGNIFTPPATSGTFTPSYLFTNIVSGCSNTATTTIVVSVCTGLAKQNSETNGLQVYPNPNVGEFTIELNNGTAKQVEVSDLTGRVILTENTSSDKMNVNISQLANGVYFVKVKSNSAIEVIKVVKQ